MNSYFLLSNKYLNGAAELLRVIQRLNLKEQWRGFSLHFLTLCTLQSTISGTRAQNHLRSIGGLEILLDGLGLPSSIFSVLKHSSMSRYERCMFMCIYYFLVLPSSFFLKKWMLIIYSWYAILDKKLFLIYNLKLNLIVWNSKFIPKCWKSDSNKLEFGTKIWGVGHNFIWVSMKHSYFEISASQH